MGQAMNKLKKGEPTAEQQDQLAKDLEIIIERVYESDIAKEVVVTSDDLYHAIFKVIQELGKKKGAIQYELQSKEDLKKIFMECHRSGTVLDKEECRKIIGKAIKFENLSIGQGAIDILLYVFGAPILALVVKRIIPGMGSIPDDVVIPIATSGSVVLLARSNKL